MKFSNALVLVMPTVAIMMVTGVSTFAAPGDGNRPYGPEVLVHNAPPASPAQFVAYDYDVCAQGMVDMGRKAEQLLPDGTRGLAEVCVPPGGSSRSGINPGLIAAPWAAISSSPEVDPTSPEAICDAMGGSYPHEYVVGTARYDIHGRPILDAQGRQTYTCVYNSQSNG